MIETKTLAGGVSVAAQIRPDELETLAATFRTIVNNRPDGEEAGPTNLWALTQAGIRDPEETLKIAAGAGYDLSGLRPRLEEKAAEA